MTEMNERLSDKPLMTPEDPDLVAEDSLDDDVGEAAAADRVYQLTGDGRRLDVLLA